MRLLLILFFLWAGYAEAQPTPSVTFRRDFHDFGSISEKNGVVSHEFIFRNNGNNPISIHSVETTCGCTATEWTRQEVPTGKEGKIKVVYDPKGRPGYFSKSIVVTMLPDSLTTTLQIRGNVTDAPSVTTEKFEHQDGLLKTKSSGFNMGKVFINQESSARTFPLFNGGSSDLIISAVQSPSYLTIQFPKVIHPGESALLSIKFNSKAKKDFGFHTDQIALVTNDPDQSEKLFSVSYTVEEYFPSLSPDALERAPRLTLSAADIKFNNLPSNSTLERDVLFRNTGKQALIIRSIVPNCTCLEANADQSNLEPGATGRIKIKFNPTGRSGRQIKSVLIYSNDPQHPVQKIILNGLVQGD